MNNEKKQGNIGLFPTYLNLASSIVKFQIQNNVTAPLVDFSSSNNTFIIKQEPIPAKQYVTYR